MKQIDSLVNMCINKGYITQEQAPWLHYGIEKRITTLLTSIPMLIVGSLISSPVMAFSFFISFFVLRTQTNGVHAKSFKECFILSILAELFFLGILPRVWNDAMAIVLLIASSISIFILAPYNHPNMELSPRELAACASSSKKRLLTLILLMAIFYQLQFNQLATGVLSGIVMVAATLTLAYIPKGGRQYEKTDENH